MPLSFDIPISTSPPAFILQHRCQSSVEDRPGVASTSSIWSDNCFIQPDRKYTNPWKLEQHYVIICDGKVISIDSIIDQQFEQQKDTVTAEQIAFIDQLNPIKDRLALSITQVAELFGVTRKSVYDWYEGVEPRANTRWRMEILIDALSSIPAEADMQRLKVVWNIPVSGQSFRAVFNNDKLDKKSLPTKLKSKLQELFPRMVKGTSSICKTTTQFGNAHIAEFDKHADFS